MYNLRKKDYQTGCKKTIIPVQLGPKPPISGRRKCCLAQPILTCLPGLIIPGWAATSHDRFAIKMLH